MHVDDRTEASAAAVLARSGELAAAYRAARPWPHLVLHDLLAPELVAAAYQEERARLAELPGHANHRQRKAETAEGLGPAAQSILALLDSDAWVGLMRELTGISDLAADPTHHWAGLHANGPGAFHALHQDFSTHPVDGRWHRANVLVYLNPEWPAAWGGQLELWEPRGRAPGAVITPVGGTVVVFETHAATLHGLPEAVACPAGDARLSLNAFYYSSAPPPGPTREPLLRRPRRPQDHWRTGFATRDEIVTGLRERLPHGLHEAGRAVKRRLGR